MAIAQLSVSLVLSLFVSGAFPTALPLTMQQSLPAFSVGDVAVVRGTVVGADTGLPIRDGMVGLIAGGGTVPPAGFPRRGPVYVHQAYLDERGRFEFAGVAPGHYRLEIIPGATFAQYVRTRYPDPWVDGASLLAVDGRQLQREIVVRLPRAAVITGRVVGDDGGPVANAFVFPFAVLPGGRLGRSAGPAWRTDDTGSFRVFGLRAGEYLLGARPGSDFETTLAMPPDPNSAREKPAPRQGYVPTLFPEGRSTSEARPIRLVDGEVHGPIELRLLRARLFKVTGVVLDGSGTPVPQLKLQLSPEPSMPDASLAGIQQSVSTSSDGTFAMSGIPEGEYKITGYRFGGGVREFVSRRVALVDHNEELVLSLRSAATVRGKLLFDGTPPTSMSRAEIRVVAGRTGAANAFMVHPEPDGSFVLAGLYGPTLVRVDGLKGWYVKDIFYGEREITDRVTEFVEDGSELRIALTDKVATVSGTVTIGGSQPTDAAVVVFSQDEQRWDPRLTTTKVVYAGTDGIFEMDGLLPGSYLAMALDRDEAELTNVGREYFAFQAQRATSFVIRDAQPVTLRLLLRGSPER